MNKECICKNDDVVKMAVMSHKQYFPNEPYQGVCPDCGDHFTEPKSQSISVLVTAPEAMQGDT